MSDYTMEELLPLLNEKVKRYTSNESTSIPYAKAEQLMGAVLYLIQGAFEQENAQKLLQGMKIPAERAYEIGMEKRRAKVQEALQFYHQILEEYVDIPNELYRAVIKEGMPEFFRRYDLEFCPQDHILTLDYPLSRTIKNKQGIDLIYAYLRQFRGEQRYLSRFSLYDIQMMLEDYHTGYEGLCINIYEIVKNAAAGS